IKDSRCVRVDMMCVLLFRLTYAPTEIVKARVAHALPTHHARSFAFLRGGVAARMLLKMIFTEGDGTRSPRSIREMVDWSTPSRAANSLWLMPRASRHLRSSSLVIMRRLCRAHNALSMPIAL